MHHLGHRFAVFEAEGTVFGSINKKDFKRLPVVAPDSRVVPAFDQVVSPLDDRIESGEGQNSTLAGIRDTLLAKLISGELRVPDAERIVGRST
jgi:type I restriction enzyme S subunit